MRISLAAAFAFSASQDCREGNGGHKMRIRKVRSCMEACLLILQTVSEKWADRFGAHVRRFNSWLAISVVCALGAGMLGCSAQGPKRNQSTSSKLPQSHSAVPSVSMVEVASWYGPGFTGHTTSTGEIYNPDELTAASKTLPIGSRVRVTNPDNGRSVVVRINDRGPFIIGRSLDLSHRAAREIGLNAKGVGRVHVSAVGVTSRERSASMSSASRDARPVYGENTTYHRRTHRRSRRRKVSNPIGHGWPALGLSSE
jgi:rare lipoprotein A (peptidoglycan hydrolase)